MCILLVEDEWLTSLAAAMALEAAGYEVLTAAHARRAISHLRENPGHFTCLVADFHMEAGVTGAHVIEFMRLRYRAIPMILTSAITYVVSDAWRLRHGVDLLHKPYEVPELVELIVRLLGRPIS